MLKNQKNETGGGKLIVKIYFGLSIFLPSIID